MLKTTQVPRKRKRRTGIKLNSGTPSPPIESGSLDYSLNFPPLTESGNSCGTPSPPIESGSLDYSLNFPPLTESGNSCDTTPPLLMESRRNSSWETPPPLVEKRSEKFSDSSPPLVELRTKISCDTPLLLSRKSSQTPQQNVKKFSECSSTQKFYRLKKV